MALETDTQVIGECRMAISSTLSELTEMLDVSLAQIYTEKNEELPTSFGATHATACGMTTTESTTTGIPTAKDAMKVTRTNVKTVVTTAGVATTITVTTTTTIIRRTRLSTVTPTDLALLSLAKESTISASS
jgi:hypothetical protein